MNEARIATAWAEAGAAAFATQHGIIAGEISERKARKTYGSWFTEAVAAGRISPVRVGIGKTATRWFSIPAILAYKAQAITRAELRTI